MKCSSTGIPFTEDCKPKFNAELKIELDNSGLCRTDRTVGSSREICSFHQNIGQSIQGLEECGAV